MLQKTRMMKLYLFRLAFRILVFLVVLFFYLTDKEHIQTLITTQFLPWISPLRIVWLVFMVIMISHLFPGEMRSMALRKEDVKFFRPEKNYSHYELLKFIQKQNVRAWYVMLIWLSINAVFGILRLCNVIDAADLFMLTVFFFLCDYICILFFCPFQTFVMKNRCCVNCRIYDWGHFMMFTPMLFIPNFFSWSLFFTSVVVLIRWEIGYAKHPERFWFKSNKTLQCANCQDKTCQIKRKLQGKPLKSN
ncbi:MAG: hypothetical protein KBS83_08185 [Lachnospiraceae bacterium]|nr:hypothetical protein [Candidatus Equihabitans merdae]